MFLCFFWLLSHWHHIHYELHSTFTKAIYILAAAKINKAALKMIKVPSLCWWQQQSFFTYMQYGAISPFSSIFVVVVVPEAFSPLATAASCGDCGLGAPRAGGVSRHTTVWGRCLDYHLSLSLSRCRYFFHYAAALRSIKADVPFDHGKFRIAAF